MGCIIPVLMVAVEHLLCRQLAVGAGQGDDLVPRSLHGPRLMDIDVPGISRDHALMRTQRCRNDGEIGLGSPHQKLNVNVLPAALLTNQGAGLVAIGVHAVAPCLLHVGRHHELHNFGMGSFRIVAVE